MSDNSDSEFVLSEDEEPREYVALPENQHRYETFTVLNETKVRSKRFQTEAKDIYIRPNDVMFTGNLQQALLNMYHLFEEIVDIYILPLPEDSYARLVISSPSLDTPISIKYQEKSLLTAETIIARIQEVAQSRKAFAVDKDLRINVLFTLVGPGGSPKSNSIFFRNSHNIITTCKGEWDRSICLLVAISMGQMLADGLLTALLKKKYRTDIQFRVMKSLDIISRFGLNADKSCFTLKDVEKIQVQWKDLYQIVVISKDVHGEFVKYKGPLCEKKVILLYENYHYDLVTNIHKIVGEKMEFCFECCQIKNSRIRHYKCEKRCKVCLSKNCFRDNRNIVSEWNLCSECNRYFPSGYCYTEHKICQEGETRSACIGYRRCKFCNQCFVKEKLDPKKHDCQTMKCYICKETFKIQDDNQHLCYVRIPDQSEMKVRVEKNHHEGRVFFFDIETKCEPNTRELQPVVVSMLKEDNTCKHTFVGDKCIEDFCNFILSGKFRHCTFLAHNSAKFDAYYLARFIINNGFKIEVIPKDSGLMYLRIMKYGIEIKDSYLFIPTALSKIPKMMDLNEQSNKSFFPYLFPFPENGNYIGQYPAPSYYDVDQKSKEYKEDVMKFLAEKKQSNATFDYMKELVLYCEQDVKCLRDGVQKFRVLFIELSKFDPIPNCMTLTHAVSKAFLLNFVQPKSIPVVPPGGYNRSRPHSRKAILWLTYLSRTMNVVIQHGRNSTHGERKLVCNGRTVYADGFLRDEYGTETVFEFAGCRYHGCRECFSGDKAQETIGVGSQQTMSDLYNAYLARKNDIIQAGFQYVSIFECVFDLLMKRDTELQQIANEFHMIEPLHPSEALVGGRTEPFVLQMKPKNGEKIFHSDIVSLYPHVMRVNEFAVDEHPEIILNPPTEDVYNQKFKGLIKARILAPRNLHIPLLPVKIGNPSKLFFTLCYSCAKESHITACKHTDKQRSFIGTFTTPETYKAIQLGYKILSVFEVWHYNKWSRHLFSGFVERFMKVKIGASGFPSHIVTEVEKEAYTKEISEKENIEIKVSEIQHNTGMRNLGKLMLNSLWGKFCQNTSKTKIKFVSEPHELFHMITSGNYDVTSVDILNEYMIQVSYKIPRDMDTPHYFQNFTIASYVTSYARLKLYEYIEMAACGHSERILYTDTDSIIGLCIEGKIPFTLGSCLGQMSDEIKSKFGVDDSIGVLVCPGCKTYAYQLENHPEMKSVRCKGITINNNNEKLVDIESMLRLVVFNKNDSIEIRYYNRMKRDSKNRRIYYENQRKTLSVTFDKRVVVSSDLDRTLPFGHIDIPDILDLDLRKWHGK